MVNAPPTRPKSRFQANEDTGRRPVFHVRQAPRAADGAQLFMDGVYAAEGDINLLIRLGELFGGSRKPQ